MRALIWPLALAIAVALSGCTHTPPADSGVKGVVTVGPISPVQQQGAPGEAPYEATIVVENSDGDKVAVVRSSADGSYHVNLAPGRYWLFPQSPGALPSAQTYDVVVRPHEFSEVDIRYDSGIR